MSKQTAYLYDCTVDGRRVSSHTAGSATPSTVNMFEQVFQHARGEAGAPPSSQVNCTSIRVADLHNQGSTSKTKPEWVHRRMAENCKASGWSTRAVTAHNKYVCKYTGTGIVDGKEVQRPFMEWKGTLASCDGMDEFMKISDSVVDNIKEYVYWSAGGDESQLDKDKFHCSIQSLPME